MAGNIAVFGVLAVAGKPLWLGVTCFFVLSGFLLYRPFADAILSGTALPSIRRYFRHRIFRMTPLRLLGMAGGAALVVKAAEYIRDWERDQAYRTVVVTRGADGSRVKVRAPRARS